MAAPDNHRSDVLFEIFIACVGVGVPLSLVVARAWLSRRTSDENAPALEHVRPGQPFEIAVPASGPFIPSVPIAIAESPRLATRF